MEPENFVWWLFHTDKSYKYRIAQCMNKGPHEEIAKLCMVTEGSGSYNFESQNQEMPHYGNYGWRFIKG